MLIKQHAEETWYLSLIFPDHSPSLNVLREENLEETETETREKYSLLSFSVLQLGQFSHTDMPRSGPTISVKGPYMSI